MNTILFVCLGNICRSPAAESVMKTLLKKNGMDHIFVDSAGTSAYHEGDMADVRMQDHARQRGYELTSLARRFDPSTDFKKFDLILTMDNSNYNNVLRLAPNKEAEKKVVPFVKWCKVHEISEVPDPYTKGAEGFELVMDIIEDACQEILTTLKKT